MTASKRQTLPAERRLNGIHRTPKAIGNAKELHPGREDLLKNVKAITDCFGRTGSVLFLATKNSRRSKGGSQVARTQNPRTIVFLKVQLCRVPGYALSIKSGVDEYRSCRR